MITLEKIMTKEILEEAHAKEMSVIAKEKVNAKLYENGDLYILGSEIACLRIAYKWSSAKKVNVNICDDKSTWYVVLYNY